MENVFEQLLPKIHSILFVSVDLQVDLQSVWWTSITWWTSIILGNFKHTCNVFAHSFRTVRIPWSCFGIGLLIAEDSFACSNKNIFLRRGRGGRLQDVTEKRLLSGTYLITACIPKDAGSLCFHRCLSVHRGGGSPFPGWYPSGHDRGTPPSHVNGCLILYVFFSKGKQDFKMSSPVCVTSECITCMYTVSCRTMSSVTTSSQYLSL